MRRVRILLGAAIVLFGAASLIHTGILLDGYEDAAARIAEAVIALVLAAALTTSLIRPAWTRLAALIGQAFALAGTGIGVFAIVRGFGPQSPLDIALHAAMVVLLVWGIIEAWRLQARLHGRY